MRDESAEPCRDRGLNRRRGKMGKEKGWWGEGGGQREKRGKKKARLAGEIPSIK
jgi:hypothetical protein